MLAALCLLSGLVNLSGCVPARWPSGDPKSLTLLNDSPLNTLLLESRHWSLRFSRAAASRHIAVLGVIHPGSGAEALTHRAARDHLDGVVLDGAFAQPLRNAVRAEATRQKLAVIELPARQEISLDPREPVAGTSDALWPGIEIEHGGKVSTGPSSAPWIDTNTGFLRFLSAATSAPVWIGQRPPPGNIFPVQRYLLAVADAAIANARWIVALDAGLEQSLLARQPQALEAWRQINGYLRYFEDHPEWRAANQFGQFAVVQDIASGGLLSAGLLDMLSVLHKTARPVPARNLDDGSLRNTSVVLNATGSLNPSQKESFARFIQTGGKLFNPPSGWSFPAVSAHQITPTPKQVDAIQPLWELTYDATLRKNFGARTFNTSTIIFTIRAAADGKQLVLHLLNYADYVSEDIAVQVTGTWKKATLYRPGEAPRNLPVYPVQDGTGMDVNKIGILGTLLIE